MGLRRLRARLLDLAVATVCVACIAAPALPMVGAAEDEPVLETGGNVDQRVLETAAISNPLNGSFEAGGSGIREGSIAWDIYSTAPRGMKLVIASDRTPAMRDAANGVDIADFGATPGAWSVAAKERRFGFSASGSLALQRFGAGQKWRGFSGAEGLEVARRTIATPRTRTTVRLRAQFKSALASNSRPTANVTATAVPNY